MFFCKFSFANSFSLMAMDIIQILLLGTLTFSANVKCQSFLPSKTNNYFPAVIELDEKDDARIFDGNRGNVLA